MLPLPGLCGLRGAPAKGPGVPAPLKFKSPPDSHVVCAQAPDRGPCSLQRAPRFPVAVITKACFTPIALTCMYFLIRSCRVRVFCYKAQSQP